MRVLAQRLLEFSIELLRPRDEVSRIAVLSAVKNYLKTLERYEKIRDSYSKEFSFERDFILRHIRGGMKHLDVGAGYGRFLGVFKEAGVRLTLVEPDPVMRAILEAQGHEPVDARASSLPFGDGSFDSVSVTWVLHDLPEGERIPSLEECFRVLRRGGVFISFEPFIEGHDPGYIAQFVRERGRILELVISESRGGRGRRKVQYLAGEKA